MHFTLWTTRQVPDGGYAEITWEFLASFLASPTVAETKDALEGWSPAKFRDNRRSRANVESVSAIALDDDASKLTTAQLASTWAGIECVIHTTHSHTEAAPKHRLVFPTSRDMTAEEHSAVWRYMRDQAAARGQVLDEATKDPSRLWYVPANREGAPFECRVITGAPLDVDRILAAAPADVAPTASAPAPRTEAPAASRRTAMAAALGASWPSKGARHHAQLALAGALRSEGFSEPEAVEFLDAIYTHFGSDEPQSKRVACVHDTYGKPADAHLVGWTRLKLYVDPVVVDAARTALGRGAESDERTMRRLAEAERPVNDTDLGEAVFDWDHVDAPIQWVIQDIVQEATVNLLFGKPNSRKSWLAWLLGACTSAGDSWLGKATRKGLVVLLDYEGSPRTSRRRMRLLKKAGLKNIRYFNPKLPLDDPRLWECLAKMGASLIIVDSLSRGMLRGGVKDQSSDPRMSVPLDLAKQLARDAGTSTIFIHHGNKGDIQGQDAVRGSGAIYAAAEGCFEAVRDDDTRTTLRCDRQKEGEAFPDITVELTDEKGLQLIDAEAPNPKGRRTFDEIKAALLLQLSSYPDGLGPAELLRKAGVRDDANAKAALRELKESGHWRKTRVGARYLPLVRRTSGDMHAAVLRSLRAGVRGTQDVCRTAQVDESVLLAMASEGLIYRSSSSWIETPAGGALQSVS